MQIVVVKIGGSLAGQHLHVVSKLVRALHEEQVGVVLVHGGGPRISSALESLGLTMPWHEGQRVTSIEAVEVVHRVLCRDVNQELVDALSSEGVRAQGLCGAEGTITAAPLPELQQTADVSYIDTQGILSLVAVGEVPVVAPVGRDESGQFCNINADLAAASIASALQAERIIFLTDVAGIYYDWDKKLRLEDVGVEDLLMWWHKGAFTQGMIPKVRAVFRALQGGMGSAYVVHGGSEEAVLAAAVVAPSERWQVQSGTRILNSGGGSAIDIKG